MNKKKNIKLLRNRIKDFIELNKKTKNFIEDKYIIEDDTVYIPVKVDDINDFLDSKSTKGFEVLSQDFIDYIEKQAYYVPTRYNLKITLQGKAATEENIELIKKLWEKHYTLELNDKNDDLRIAKLTSIILFTIGALFFVGTAIISTFKINEILKEFCSIAATFSLWEAVDYILIEASNCRIRRFDTAQLLFAEIDITNLND